MSKAQSHLQWFRIDPVEKTFEGPLTLEDLKTGLSEQTYFWSDLALCPARGFHWMRLLEIPELVALCPAAPDAKVLQYFAQVAFKQHDYKKVSLQVPKGVELTRAGGAGSVKIQKEKIQQDKTGQDKTGQDKTVVRVAPSVSKPVQAPTQSASASVSKTPEWYLLIDDQECGPFSMDDIAAAVKKGKKPDRAYVWKEGMKRWMPIAGLKVFSHLKLGGWGSEFLDLDDEAEEFVIENYSNKRRAFRRSVVASVFRIGDTGISQFIGICGDLSAEGFMLEQDVQRVDYKVGSRHQIELRPISKSILKPFRSEVEVRWVNPENFSIGFQFIKLHPIDQKLLLRYLESLEKRPK